MNIKADEVTKMNRTNLSQVNETAYHQSVQEPSVPIFNSPLAKDQSDEDSTEQSEAIEPMNDEGD